jgi:hypothetical protein
VEKSDDAGDATASPWPVPAPEIDAFEPIAEDEDDESAFDDDDDDQIERDVRGLIRYEVDRDTRGRIRYGYRARSESCKKVQLKVLQIGRLLWPENPEHPSTRGECPTQRPCPYVSCRHHLLLDVNEQTGTIKFNFPGTEPWELAVSCSLDVADLGGSTLESVAAVLNVSRERIRQIEAAALVKLRKAGGDELAEFLIDLARR